MLLLRPHLALEFSVHVPANIFRTDGFRSTEYIQTREGMNNCEPVANVCCVGIQDALVLQIGRSLASSAKEQADSSNAASIISHTNPNARPLIRTALGTLRRLARSVEALLRARYDFFGRNIQGVLPDFYIAKMIR